LYEPDGPGPPAPLASGVTGPSRRLARPDAGEPLTVSLYLNDQNRRRHHWNGYSNPKVNKLFAEAGTQTDRAKRDDLYLQGAKIAFDDFAFVPIAGVYDVGVFKGKYCDFNSIPAVPWNADLGTIQPVLTSNGSDW
jgi:ABC-type transport system substrate-binding protein